jgi:hypothetical protein
LLIDRISSLAAFLLSVFPTNMKSSDFLTPAIVYALATGISFAVAAMIKVIDRALHSTTAPKN